MLRGIDISSHQSSSYDTDGLSFVFVKATEGRSYVNPKLAAQTKRGRDAGLVVGFYHFLWPGNLTDQAEYFVAKTPETPRRGRRAVLTPFNRRRRPTARA
ncbi:hypothetical protein SALBM217S_10533 [Streptomyces griseoloalbus]